MSRVWLVSLLLLAPSVCRGVDKEIVRLQRDVAILNEDVRNLQRSVDERMGALMALLQQTLDRVNEVHTANSLMQSTLTDRLSQQEKSVSVPVATLGAKLDQVASGSVAVRDDVADVNARLKRLEQRLVDIDNAVRVINAPLPPPPSASDTLGGAPAGVTAQGLFQSATADQLAGHYELAMQGFQEYLKHFGNTELAASSQFHIGEIALYQGDLKSALEAFDIVLEAYPKSGKAPDALYLKAKVFEKQRRRSQAVQELKNLLRKYPNSDAASRAKPELKRLGSASRSATTASRK